MKSLWVEREKKCSDLDFVIFATVIITEIRSFYH